jgi:hypothetical protein
MEITFCLGNCCKLYKRKYLDRKKTYSFRKKAGTILYIENIIGEIELILVQSNGNFWGFPKGGYENDETAIDCAKRETYEETGIDISLFEMNRIYKSKYYTYFLLNLNNMTKGKIIDIISKNVQQEIEDNTGITMIKISCLIKMYKNKMIKLNKQCIEILNRIFHIPL